MSAVTFDAFKFINRLKEAGVPEKQAIAEALSEAVSTIQWVTKTDLQLELSPIKTEITLLKWMIGLSLALSVGIISMLAKITVLPPH
ncbi:MAG TPA: hypothetical protein PK283_03735 [Thiotrichales bacterium]|nr:hypothetical protein [Thiotrichales bacterium]